MKNKNRDLIKDPLAKGYEVLEYLDEYEKEFLKVYLGCMQEDADKEDIRTEQYAYKLWKEVHSFCRDTTKEDGLITFYGVLLIQEVLALNCASFRKDLIWIEEQKIKSILIYIDDVYTAFQDELGKINDKGS